MPYKSWRPRLLYAPCTTTERLHCLQRGNRDKARSIGKMVLAESFGALILLVWSVIIQAICMLDEVCKQDWARDEEGPLTEISGAGAHAGGGTSAARSLPFKRLIKCMVVL